MKLTDIETFVVGNPPPHFGGRYFVFVKITTDTGVSGIGEAYCVPFEPHLVMQRAMIRMTSKICGGGFIRAASPSIQT
jgi:L-alanine-DL-glutamate epimerase-like enolase superfamily enzyme